MPDLAAARRADLRWHILVCANAARPYTASETLLMEALRDIVPGLTPLELRQELDYLVARELLSIASRQTEIWVTTITRHGVDVVEYTVDVDPGIGRPQKYWGR